MTCSCWRLIQPARMRSRSCQGWKRKFKAHPDDTREIRSMGGGMRHVNRPKTALIGDLQVTAHCNFTVGLNNLTIRDGRAVRGEEDGDLLLSALGNPGIQRNRTGDLGHEHVRI